MESTPTRRPRALVVAALVTVVALTGGISSARAHDGDIEETIGKASIEVTVDGRAAIDGLIDLGFDLAEYVRDEPDGRFTVIVVVDDAERAQLEALGYTLGRVIDDHSTWVARIAERNAALAAEERSHDAAETGKPSSSGSFASAGARSFAALPENVVNRVDYFQNYAGWFLSVEVFNRATNGTGTSGPTVSFSWRTAGGSYGSATTMSRYIDTDPTPDVYLYHTALIRLGPASPPYGSGTAPTPPAFIRVGTSTPGEPPVEAAVRPWVNNPLPPTDANFSTQYFTAYMDPTQVRDRIRSLNEEFGGPGGITELITLPHLTQGYNRRSMCVMAGTTACNGTPGTTSQAVYLEAKLRGYEGGNNIRAQFANPGAANAPLTVTVTPYGVAPGQSTIVVSLATSGTGALTSTAAQVVAAINASPEASALVTAATYAGNTGTGIVQARALVNLSDFLSTAAAAANVDRTPFQMQALRISKDAGKAPADSHKVGVYLFCQQHAREWVTNITCVQTAELLLRNYATDPRTRELVDNLDIFILPSVNPDGGHYSLYDFNSQRRNLVRYCPITTTSGMPANRNAWGVDLNRNSSSYSLFDGYFGASASCTSDVFAGPSEVSEVETKNMNYIVDTFSNVKFANNIHTSGGYFMWAPGSYIGAGRITAPAPNHGIEAYFWDAADTVLQRIKDVRGTAVLPQRTGPIADVLYSAAGNAADDFWYRKGIIAYSFEAGSDRFTSTTTGTAQSGVGFFPNFANEGRFEALEFAAGNFGLLESALAYAQDKTPPVVEMTGPRVSPNPIETTFKWVNEPSVVYYTLDGSTPNGSSPQWERQRFRGPGENFTFSQSTTVKWLAVDIAGNSSTGQARFSVNDQTPPTISIVKPADGEQFLLGSTQQAEFSCDDDDSGVESCVGTVANGANLSTSTIGFKTITVDAKDNAGNTATKTHTYNVYWPFTGFAPPFGKRNDVQAGSAYPIKFSLGANRGLSILSGVTSIQIDCATSAPIGTEESADKSALSYSATTGLYQFDWKTKKAWLNTCRELRVKLVDNTTKTATFFFKS